MSSLSNWETLQEMGYQERFDRLEAEDMKFDSEVERCITDIELGRPMTAKEVCGYIDGEKMDIVMQVIARHIYEQHPKDDTQPEKLLRALLDNAVRAFVKEQA
jgi:hypothetical protein